jgi:hypothetical protein
LANQATVVSIGEGQELQKQQLAQNIDAFISRASELLENEYITLELEAQVNTELIDAAMQLKDQVLNIEAFTDPQIVADLAVNFEGTTPSDIAYAEGKLYVADSSRGVVYSMGTTIGSEARVFASNFVKPYLLDADEDGDIVVIDEAVDSCISTINTDNAEVLRHVGLSQSKIGKLSAMDIWPYNKTLYSANPAKQAVLKQENVAGNYQIPNDSAPWRSDPDFVNARDIAVDGGIFVLIGGKGLLRYWAGQPDSYEIKGLIESDVTALTNATAFEITDTKAYFALPSVTGGRVLVFDRSVDTKQMTFKYQFVYRGETAGIFSDIKELVANDAAGELFVLDGTKIIRLKLS